MWNVAIDPNTQVIVLSLLMAKRYIVGSSTKIRMSLLSNLNVCATFVLHDIIHPEKNS